MLSYVLKVESGELDGSLDVGHFQFLEINEIII